MNREKHDFVNRADMCTEGECSSSSVFIHQKVCYPPPPPFVRYPIYDIIGLTRKIQNRKFLPKRNIFKWTHEKDKCVLWQENQQFLN